MSPTPIQPSGKFRPKYEPPKPKPPKPENTPSLICGQNSYPLRCVEEKFSSVDEYAARFTEEDMLWDQIQEFIQYLRLNFQEGDEIMIYDDFKVAPPLCGRAFDFHVRGNVVQKAMLTRMS